MEEWFGWDWLCSGLIHFEELDLRLPDSGAGSWPEAEFAPVEWFARAGSLFEPGALRFEGLGFERCCLGRCHPGHESVPPSRLPRMTAR